MIGSSLRCLTLLAIGMGALTVHGQNSYVAPSSDPRDLFALGDYIYFTADDGVHGRELWRCNAEGDAGLVLDITPGIDSSEISKFQAFGALLLFRVDPPATGSELWRSDGTAQGTRRIKTFNGDLGERFEAVCGVWEQGHAFIRVNTVTSAIWRTDGTEAGTLPLPMTTGGGMPIGVEHFGLIHNGFFYFAGQHPTRGPILARCDAAGHMVEEVDRLTTPARELVAIDWHRLIFRSSDQIHGEELFISGGTAEYTNMLRDIGPGPRHGKPSGFTLVANPAENPLMVFSADDGVHGTELWITDGLPEGTRMIADLWIGEEDASPGAFHVDRDRVYFVARTPESGKELWSVSRPYNAPQMLLDVFPGETSSDPYALCVLPGHGLFFSALEPSTGKELYFANPHSGAVLRVRDIFPGEKSSNPSSTVALKDRVVFAATDPIHGRELWYADATGQARLLADIYTDASVNPSSSPSRLTPVGSQLFFVANDIAHGEELWVSDGSDEGTRLVRDIYPGRASSMPRDLTPYNTLLYFSAEAESGGAYLWRSDGTPEGTVVVSQRALTPLHLAASPGGLYFSAERVSEGRELWKTGSDGTAYLVKDIAKGTASSAPRNIVVFQDMAYFLADDGIHGEELWRSDGSENGTILVRDIVTVPFESIRFDSMAPGVAGLFLSGASPSHGAELWWMDEPASQLRLVKDIASRDMVAVFRTEVE